MKTLCILLLALFAAGTSFSQSPESEKAADTTNITRCVFVDNPEFPGRHKAFLDFLSKNLRYPKNSADNSGRVILSFIVQIDGRLTNLKVIRGISPGYNKEALRVMKKSPKWIPAKENNKPRVVQYSIPITFK